MVKRTIVAAVAISTLITPVAISTLITLLISGPLPITDAFSFSPLSLPRGIQQKRSNNVVNDKTTTNRLQLWQTQLYLSSTTTTLPPGIENQPTELPDSLSDAASIAANACNQLYLTAGTTSRCRVDFDTSIGDETYTTLKSSTEFMQQFVTSLCLASIEGVREWKMESTMKLVEAKAELRDVRDKMDEIGLNDNVDSDVDDEFMFDGELVASSNNDNEGTKITMEDESSSNNSEETNKLAKKEAELLQLIANEGQDPTYTWTGPKVRIYFPDEGSAALARRDWKTTVPPCVQFSSCGGVQVADISKDEIIIFFCPRASEAESVEEILYKIEEVRGDELQMTVMVNPLLVDMGVTGFGMAGRRLRERLIDGLLPAYYLRTLPWGALTRVWPQLFTVWQEDENAEEGYRMIKAMDRLPSNPEVEDIYDFENGNMNAPSEGPGFLNALGDFVNGMTKL